MHVRVAGPFDHANVVLADRPLVLGRDPHCEVVLDDPGVSGRHALLQRTPAGVEVVDLGSANGVFVDGQLVRKAMVGPGHVIRIGATELTFDLRDEVHARVNETLSLPRLQALPAPQPYPTPPYVGPPGPPGGPGPRAPPKRRSAVPIVLLVLLGMTALVAAAGFGVWRWLEAGGTLGAGPSIPSARPGASGSSSPPMPNASAGIPAMVFDRNPFEDE